MQRDTALVVMARYPTVGLVKTRLAADIGAEPACRLYRAFLADLQDRFQTHPQFDLVWAYEPARSDFAAMMSRGAVCQPQCGAGLGERMRHAFEHLFERGYARVVMIGADVPHVADGAITAAIEALAAVDVVLGPSADGGYYLIAMSALHEIFHDVAMGTRHVLAQTLRLAEAANLRSHLLPMGFDIDDAADLEKLAALLASGEGPSLPHSGALLLAKARQGQR